MLIFPIFQTDSDNLTDHQTEQIILHFAEKLRAISPQDYTSDYCRSTSPSPRNISSLSRNRLSPSPLSRPTSPSPLHKKRNSSLPPRNRSRSHSARSSSSSLSEKRQSLLATQGERDSVKELVIKLDEASLLETTLETSGSDATKPSTVSTQRFGNFKDMLFPLRQLMGLRDPQPPSPLLLTQPYPSFLLHSETQSLLSSSPKHFKHTLLMRNYTLHLDQDPAHLPLPSIRHVLTPPLLQTAPDSILRISHQLHLARNDTPKKLKSPTS